MSARQAGQPRGDESSAEQRAARRILLATCVAAAARAAEIIQRGGATRSAITWEEKSRADFVSDVDRAAEEAIVALIAERHPNARVLGEELSPTMTDRAGLVFVVDPLDGTTNFLHGFPWYAVSIAALVDDVLAAGVILNVSTGELFTATAGDGARCNGQPIAVSTIDNPGRALVGTGFPFKYGDEVDEYMRMMAALMKDAAGVRRAGSAALDLASVACGHFDAFFELRLSPWDIAAGILLIREAGGVVTDLAGNQARVASTGLIAGSPALHPWLLKLVTNSGLNT
jgi:myo-inositol-1(or 4)-monophosphatase